MEENPNLMLV